MVDIKKIEISVLLFFLFLNFARADEPLVFFDSSELNILMLPGSSANFEVMVKSLLGDEDTYFTTFAAGDIASWVSFVDNFFIISPGSYETVPFRLEIPFEASEGIYNGSVRLSTSQGQMSVLNVSVNVTGNIGRVVLESFYESEVPENFNVTVLDSGGSVVDSGVVSSGYWFSKYLPFGSYSVSVLSEIYQEKELSFNIFNSEKRVLLLLEKRKGPFLSVEPQHSYVETCPDSSDFSTIRLRNDGFEILNVSLHSSNSIINIDSPELVLGAGDFTDVRFEVLGLSPGNYESEIVVEHLGFQDFVNVFIEVYPRTACESVGSGVSVEYSNSTIIPLKLDHFFVLTVDSRYSVSILRVEEVSTDFPVSFVPKYYSGLKSDSTVPFLVKTYSNYSDTGFIILRIRSDRGEESIVIQADSKPFDGGVLVQEISDLRDLLNVFENTLLKSGSDNLEDLKKISNLKLELNNASNFMGSNVELSKQIVDGVLNKGLDFFDIYTPKKIGDNPLILLLFIVVSAVILFVVLRNKLVFKKYLKKLRAGRSGV